MARSVKFFSLFLFLIAVMAWWSEKIDSTPDTSSAHLAATQTFFRKVEASEKWRGPASASSTSTELIIEPVDSYTASKFDNN